MPIHATHSLSAAGRRLLVPAAACLAIGLSGCLLNRVSDVREQLCDFDANFEFDFGETPGLTFHRPVILDRDVAWIAGAEPTEIVRGGGELTMRYVVEKVDTTGRVADTYRVDFLFNPVEGENRLSEIRLGPEFSTVIQPEFFDRESIDAAAARFCETGWNLASPGMVVDISDQDLNNLPGRLEIIDWLGPPLATDPTEGLFHYEFRLKKPMTDPDAEPSIASVDIWFDDKGDRPLRVISSYSRFHSTTDFRDKTVSVKVSL